MTSYRTEFVNKETVSKEWVVIDAEQQVLGRLSSKIAMMIRGKHKPSYSPHVDCGDNVIVINAEKVLLTGNKMSDKRYIRYTGYPGGQREASPRQVLEKHPIRLVEMAVRGMLPKSRLGRSIFGNLYVYAGSEHPHAAQQPKEVKL